MAREHRLAGQQLDNLCGPHWGAALLRAFGDVPVDTEEVAILAGSLLPTGDPSTWTPRGASNRLDYRVPLPVARRPELSGTSAPGLVEAVSRASEGRFAMVPLRTAWSEERVEALLLLCEDKPRWEAIPVCNVRTGRLWGSHPPLMTVLDHFAGEDVEGPEPEWDVGHYVSVAGVVRSRARSMVLVRDSYPMFGWDAHYLEPAAAAAEALDRGDGREGGVLLFVAAEHAEEVGSAAKERGFEVGAWDNGTPWPPTDDVVRQGGEQT